MYIISIFCIGLLVAWYCLRAESLLRRESPSRLQRMLGYILLWWGLSTLKDLSIYIPGVDADTMLRHISYIDGCGALTFALLLMELTMPQWVTWRRLGWMALPFVLFLLLHLVISAEWLDVVYTAFFVSFALTAVGIAIVKARHYAKAIRETYSDLTDVDISWMWTVVGLFTACQLIWWAVSRQNDFLADTFYYVSSLVCWQLTVVGINRMRPPSLNLTSAAADVTAEPRNYTAALAGRLEALMAEEQLYLNADLTLSDLVGCLGSNRTYLSEYISTQLHTTFYDYVNQLRIEQKAVPMMLDRAHDYTLEYISAQSGFKSISTFRRAFKKFVGMLPSEFLQAHQ